MVVFCWREAVEIVDYESKNFWILGESILSANNWLS